jgi:ribosome-binding factor A
MAILADLKDPRVRGVTVTRVEMTPDMRQARVYVSVMGDETRQRLTLHGLQSAAGYLQSKVAQRIDTRYTPRIEFLVDEGVKKSIEIARILREVLPSSAEGSGAANEPTDYSETDAAEEFDAEEDEAVANSNEAESSTDAP